MKLFRVGAFTALALVGTTPAMAQSLHGVRAEANIGIDRFYSEGNHDNHLGWGGEVGADFDLGGFILGPYGSFWMARGENVTRDGPGVAFRKSFEEWGVGLRAGTLITPSTLVYAKGGWVINEQRKFFDADPVATPGIPVNDAFGDYYNHYRTRGWQVGAGIQQDVSNMFYVKGEGRYSNYRTNSSRLAFLVGAGVRFGGAEAAPPPPPPAAAPAAPAAACYADVPGWVGDPGDRGLPGSAASAAAAAAGARARIRLHA